MQQMIVGTKYQIVIPKDVRRKVGNLQPGSKVNVYPVDKDTIEIKRVSENWSDKNYGAFKKYWQGIDPINEVRKMREEWEERLKKLDR